jgi:hypothetical protein
MSASTKFDPVKFIDQLMADGKWRSERQIMKALVTAYTDQAKKDLKVWVAALNTNEDQGLRLKEMGALNGKKDSYGMPTRYPYWRVEQDSEKITPGDPLERLARIISEERRAGEAEEEAKFAEWAKTAGTDKERNL